MLTENQINQLRPLTKHPKFGKLLLDAIEGWKTSDPIQDDFGISRKWDMTSLSFLNIMESYFEDYNMSCLIGAACVNKNGPDIQEIEEQDYMILICMNNYNISEEEFYGIIRGFDDDTKENSQPYDQKAFEFGSEVRKIIFGK